MKYQCVDWNSIEKQEKGLVEIHGALVGEIIEDLGERPQIKMSLGPRPNESELAPIVNNLDMRVRVVFPSDFISRSTFTNLRYARELNQHVEVSGTYTPKRDGDYVGEVVARKISLHVY